MRPRLPIREVTLWRGVGVDLYDQYKAIAYDWVLRGASPLTGWQHHHVVGGFQLHLR